MGESIVPASLGLMSAPASVRPDLVTVTERAVARIEELLAQRDAPAEGIRVGVRSGGCSGLAYTVEYAPEIHAGEEVVWCEGKWRSFGVVIEPKAVLYLVGSVMDFSEEEMQSGFTFRNPNEKGRCGCGESFHV